MGDRPSEYCLFWVQSLCMPRDEWASWTEAVGSVFAVLAAIGVVAWQQKLANDERIAAAKIAAPGVLTSIELLVMTLPMVIQLFDSLIRGDRGGRPLVSSADLADAIDAVQLPLPDDLVRLSASLPKSSIGLASVMRSIPRISQGLRALESRDSVVLSQLLTPHTLATTTMQVLEEAEIELRAFCDSVVKGVTTSAPK